MYVEKNNGIPYNDMLKLKNIENRLKNIENKKHLIFFGNN